MNKMVYVVYEADEENFYPETIKVFDNVNAATEYAATQIYESDCDRSKDSEQKRKAKIRKYQMECFNPSQLLTPHTTIEDGYLWITSVPLETN